MNEVLYQDRATIWKNQQSVNVLQHLLAIGGEVALDGEEFLGTYNDTPMTPVLLKERLGSPEPLITYDAELARNNQIC
jgi:hypothetical protein